MVPAWAETPNALAVPAIAFAGVAIASMNFWLALRRRADELFDRRYEFFRRVRSIWLSTGNGAAPGEQPWFDWEDIEGFAQEAEFLFGRDVAEHLRSLAGKQFGGLVGVPDPEFTERFRKYLSLGGR